MLLDKSIICVPLSRTFSSICLWRLDIECSFSVKICSTYRHCTITAFLITSSLYNSQFTNTDKKPVYVTLVTRTSVVDFRSFSEIVCRKSQYVEATAARVGFSPSGAKTVGGGECPELHARRYSDMSSSPCGLSHMSKSASSEIEFRSEDSILSSGSFSVISLWGQRRLEHDRLPASLFGESLSVYAVRWSSWMARPRIGCAYIP